MRRSLPRASSESGETLIEVLMASALMLIVVLTIVGGVITMMLSSKIHREQADGNATLVAAMEQLKAPIPGPRCPAGSPTPTSPATYAITQPNVTVKSIEYQITGTDTNGNHTVDWSTSATKCNLNSALTLQRITLLYTSPGSRVTPELSFIKGKY